MKNQQKPSKSIDSYLVNLIEESVKSALQQKSLQEKEKQGSSPEPEAAKDSKDLESSKMKKGDVTVDDVIDKLNSIRSGKSFKDDAIKNSFEEYFNKLDQAEKTAMFAFLKAISQIITGEVDPNAALDPSDKPAEIEMKKSNAPKAVKIKPTVTKSPKEEKKPSEEDTSGPVPISPKKK